MAVQRNQWFWVALPKKVPTYVERSFREVIYLTLEICILLYLRAEMNYYPSPYLSFRDKDLYNF